MLLRGKTIEATGSELRNRLRVNRAENVAVHACNRNRQPESRVNEHNNRICRVGFRL